MPNDLKDNANNFPESPEYPSLHQIHTGLRIHQYFTQE